MPKRKTKAEREMYASFEAEFKFCFCCHYSPRRHRFRDWSLPHLENAHIVGDAGRADDRRDIVRLCNGCHRLSHGDMFKIDGEQLPNLTRGNLCWLKQEHDPEYYDLDFLNELATGENGIDESEVVQIPDWFLNEREQYPSP